LTPVTTETFAKWKQTRKDKKEAEAEALQKAIDEFGIKPHEAMIVEDAPHGVEAGRRSGGVLCQVTGFNEVDYARVKRSLEGAG